MKTKFQAIDDEIAAFKAERFGRQMETNEFDADAPKIFSKETKEKKNFAETESLLSIGAENDNSGLGPVPLLLDLAMNALLEFNARSLQKCEKKKSYVKNIALSKPCLEPMHAVTDSSGKDKPTPRTVTVPLLLQMAFDAFALSRAKV